MERRLRVATMGLRQARSPEGKRALKEKKISLTLLKPLLETTETRPNRLWVLPHSRFPLSKPPFSTSMGQMGAPNHLRTSEKFCWRALWTLVCGL